jgi:hypothetical protein
MSQGFLKMGMYGDPKSGKTYTASLIALGLHKRIQSKKPITFFDTETGSEYVLSTLYKPAGVELQSVKSRSFADLMNATKEAGEISDILIVDSVTHVWKELMDAYKSKKGLDYIRMDDWQVLKKEWAAFTDLYLNSKLHIIVCGRAQDVWEDRINERGKVEKAVVGSKMATEKNLAYEPSLLVEMEKVAQPETGFLIPRAWVLGDRFSQLDGKVFDKPTFETFLPHIDMLNLGGEHVGIDTTRSSEGLFVPDSPDGRYEYQKKRDIALEELADEVSRRWSGQSVEQKNARIDVLKACFGTSSQTAIENLTVNVLQEGLAKIRSGMFEGIGEKESAAEAKANGSHKETAKKAKAA